MVFVAKAIASFFLIILWGLIMFFQQTVKIGKGDFVLY